MKENKFELNLYGQTSEKFDHIKKELSTYLAKIKLPLTIVEKRSMSQIMATYNEDKFIINESNQLQKLFDFLLKVNPETGKVCKCNDCNNCPSKRMEATLAKVKM